MKKIQVKINGEWQEIEDLELTCLNEETYDIETVEDIRLLDESECEDNITNGLEQIANIGKPEKKSHAGGGGCAG